LGLRQYRNIRKHTSAEAEYIFTTLLTQRTYIVTLKNVAALLIFGGTALHASPAETLHTIGTHPDLGLLSVIGLGILGGGVFSALRTRRHQR
jgi:hypothetical protein